MNSLQRLFKICIYYPSGHVILNKATERFLRQLKTLAGDNLSVTISDCRNSLLLEDVELNGRLPFVQEIKTIMAELGVTSITIAREITMPEVHAFVRKLLFYKSKMISSNQFKVVEVSELPPTVTIKLKKFIARKDASISDQKSGEPTENIDALLDFLGDAGLNPEEVGQCQKLLESMSERLARFSCEIGELPCASWEDIARLLARTVKGSGRHSADAGKGRQSGQASLNALASILRKLEHEVDDKQSQETINFLVKILKRPLTDTEEVPVEDDNVEVEVLPEKQVLKIGQIQEIVTYEQIQPGTLVKLGESSNREEMLSMLMQMVPLDLNLQGQTRLQYLFREMLAEKITVKTWDILSGGLLAMVQAGNVPKIALIMRYLSEILRDSQYGSSLFLLLVVAKQCQEEESSVLWPYVVNELLVVGSRRDKAAHKQLCQYAAAFSLEEMRAGLTRLEELDAFQDNAIATDIFHSEEFRCYSLFSFLLETDIGQYVGKRIIGGLRSNPADWLMKALAPLLDYSQPDHKFFLSLYLNRSSPNQLPAAIKFVVAKIIAESLTNLASERRHETWVPETISACEKIPTREIRTLLEDIASEKKLLLFSQWPGECKKAAAGALAAMKT